MRLSTILTTTALACQASARWVAWTPEPVMDLRFGDLARPTQPSEVDDYQVWAPEPTQPPSKAIVDLLLHRRVKTDSSSSSSAPSSNNTWENEKTCGYYSGISSSPYVCAEPLTCATKDDVVACATDGVEGFYSVCLNLEAVKSGKCNSVGVQTGCCQGTDLPACGTLVWGGATPRSMFKCFSSATFISMIDQPQYIVDSSISAASASSVSVASAAAAASSSSAEAAAEAASRGGHEPSTVIATTTAADGSTSTYASVIEGDSHTSATAGAGAGNGGDTGGSSTNTGAVAGGVIGGIALLLLIIAFLVWYVMRKKNKKFTLSLCGGKKNTNKEKHVHNKTYNNEKSFTKNDQRAYDKRSYGKESNDYDQWSRSATPNQNHTHNQNFHLHIEDDRYDTTPESRSPAPLQPLPAILVTKPSKREQRRQARHERMQQQRKPQREPERNLEAEEMEQAREQHDYQRHRYHPSSGQRHLDASRTPSPPSLPQPPAPTLDFIGRGI